MKWRSAKNRGQLQFADAPDFRIISQDSVATSLPKALQEVLAGQNGFYAFADALHIFFSDENASEGSIEWWNQPAIWLDTYPDEVRNYVFFAEDIFGWQYACKAGRFYQFDPVEGTFTYLTDTYKDWSNLILGDPTEYCGYQFARDWRETHPALADNERIFVYPPFAFEDNGQGRSYKPVPRTELMRFYGDMYIQLRDIPEGDSLDVKFQ